MAKPDDSLQSVVASLKKIEGKLSDLHCQLRLHVYVMACMYTCLLMYILFPNIIGSTVEVFTYEGILRGQLFQGRLMKSVYSSYPEVLLVDATYKLTNLRMPVYILMAINGNGQGEVVMICLTAFQA